MLLDISIAGTRYNDKKTVGIFIDQQAKAAKHNRETRPVTLDNKSREFIEKKGCLSY
jgi:hypothetical protein